MKLITSIIILSFLVIPNSASTNTSDPLNNKRNLFTKENINNIMNVFVSCTEQIPLNEIAAILEDYMDTDEDIKDFMAATIHGDDFHRILTFAKHYYKRLFTPINEIVSVISDKPAMQPMKAANKIINKLFKAVESANLNLGEFINIIRKFRVVEMQETIKKASQEKLLRDQDFLNLVKFIDNDVIVAAWRRLLKRILRNEALQKVIPRYSENSLFTIARDFSEKFSKYATLKGLVRNHQIPLPEKVEKKFVSDVVELTATLFLYVETDEELQGFINHLNTDEFQGQLSRVFERVSVGGGAESFIRDEL